MWSLILASGSARSPCRKFLLKRRTLPPSRPPPAVVDNAQRRMTGGPGAAPYSQATWNR